MTAVSMVACRAALPLMGTPPCQRCPIQPFVTRAAAIFNNLLVFINVLVAFRRPLSDGTMP